MYRLLIVDDEPDVLLALHAFLVEQEDLDIDVLTASSAAEALKILDLERLDILLSDICMPGMNGIELLRRVRDNWPDCRTIFLSGYTEFAYIYEAEKLEAVSYLLKTESRSRIIETVRKAIEQIDEANRIARLEQLAVQKGVERPYLMREVMESLTGGDWSAHLSQTIRHLHPGFDTGRPVLMAVGRVNSSERPDFHQKARFLALLEDLAIRHLCRHFQVMLGETERWHLMFLLQPGDPAADQTRLAHLARGSFETIQTLLMDNHGIYLSIVIHAQEQDLTSIQPTYEHLVGILRTELRYGAGIRMLGLTEQPDGLLSDENQAIAMVRTIVEQHYDRPLSLTWLAGQVYLNPSYLSRLFKRLTRMTLIHYINQVRISRAKELLLTTNMKVSDIAAGTGFESPSYFNQAFKKQVGLAPIDFRQNKKED
ncbi:MAG: response regulator [Bacillota bacterium]|nr:response regulator [Bacillota bacterium]